VPERADNRARIVPPGYRKPSHGRGMLKNFEPGNPGGGRRGTRFTETVELARAHSIEAIRTLAERLHDADGRIAVVAANSLLERAWGKVREQKPEEQGQASIDLSQLSSAELAIMVRLVESGRLRAAPDAPGDAPAVIDAKPEPESDR
jgi:hypothetical protein